jgi:hypothetical protein
MSFLRSKLYKIAYRLAYVTISQDLIRIAFTSR